MSKANNHPEYPYPDLGREILRNGIKQGDRGTQVATKRVYWNGVLRELYWFFAGLTNIKYLVDNNVHIWDDSPFKKFKIKNQKSKMSKEEFIEKIRTDKAFARRWGELPRIYGEMWRKWPTRKKGRTIDQLSDLF